MSTVTKPILTNEVFTAKMDALIAKFGTKTLTITALANDGVSLVNQTIKVYNSNTMALVSTLVYNTPTSLTIDLPDNFSYLVVPECTMTDHYCDDRPSGMLTTNTTVTLTYKTIANITTFPALKAALSAGLGSKIPLGWEVSYTDTELGEMTYECVDWDDGEQTMTLLSKYILATDRQFDAPEALYYCSAALPAGAYKFKNGSTDYYFTLTQEAAQGSQLVASTSSFTMYTTKGGTTVGEQGSVSTTALENPTDLGTTGAGNLNHWDRVNYGSNDYGECAIRQYLNGTGNNWWSAQTGFDRPSSYAVYPSAVNGFMTGIPQNVLDVIDNTAVKCVSQNIYCAPDSSHAKNQKYTVNDKFFLASQREIFNSSDFDDGGRVWVRYINQDRRKSKKNSVSAGTWWLRSPYGGAHYERFVSDSGSGGTNGANNSLGVVAACKISASPIS